MRLRAAVGGWVRYLMLMVKGEGDDDGDSPLSRQENGALSILVVIHRHIIISTPSTPTTKDDYWIAVDRQTYSNRF